MTCIVALEHEGKVILGSDSFLGDGNIRDVIDSPKFFVKGELAVAFAGGVRAFQVVEHHLKLRKRRKNEKEMTYLVNHVAASIRKALELAGVPVATDKHDTLFLLAYEGKVYVLQEDFSVVRSKHGFAAIGAGQDYAYGALVALEQVEIPALDRVELALKAAAEMSPQVCAPFHIAEV